jgi:hypothetical protein
VAVISEPFPHSTGGRDSIGTALRSLMGALRKTAHSTRQSYKRLRLMSVDESHATASLSDRRAHLCRNGARKVRKGRNLEPDSSVSHKYRHKGAKQHKRSAVFCVMHSSTSHLKGRGAHSDCPMEFRLVLRSEQGWISRAKHEDT